MTYQVLCTTPNGKIVRDVYFTSAMKAVRDVEEFSKGLEFTTKSVYTDRNLGILPTKILIRDYEVCSIEDDMLHYVAEIYKLIVN